MSEELKEAIDALEAKLNKARKDYTDAAKLYRQGMESHPHLEYKRGLYGGIERAWREVVFLKTEVEAEQ